MIRQCMLRPVLAAALLASAACGDPLVVTGDPPALMRRVLGVPNTLNGPLTDDALTSVVREPGAVAATADGLLYAADQGRRAPVTPGGGLANVARIVAVSSSGALDVILDGDGCPGDGCIQRVRAMALDGAGRIVLSDDMGRRVWRLDPATGAATLLAGNGTFGTAPDGATATAATLADPVGVAVAADGRVFIAEHSGNRVVSVGTDGILRVEAGDGTPGNTGDGAAASAARLNAPAGLALINGTLYVADEGNHRIRRLVLGQGTIHAVAGTGEPGASDGAAGSARFRLPWGLAVTPDGAALFVAERESHRVRAVGLASGSVSTFAGTGEPGYTGSGGPAGDTGLNRPSGVATALDFLFIADAGNGVVWRARIRF